MNRRAIILAGGLGTRLYPYTLSIPKPLVAIGDYPILEIVIRQLAKNSFNHITLAVNHQANLIMDYFGTGRKFGIKIDYSLEEKPLGTIGPLNNISDLPDNFLLMNGDILTDLDYLSFYNYHIDTNSIFTISSFIRENKIDYGVLKSNNVNNLLMGFEEKPINKYEVSMGVYMVNKKSLVNVPGSILYGFDQLMIDLLRNGMHVLVKKHEGYWLDIGRPDDYHQAIKDFNVMKSRFLDV